MLAHALPGLPPFLTNRELGEFSCVCRLTQSDTQVEREKRKKRCARQVMYFFHPAGTHMFTYRRIRQTGLEKNLRQLFRMIPEWFAYLDAEEITYLDLPYPRFGPLYPDVGDHIEPILFHLARNRSLVYCNLGLWGEDLALQKPRLETLMREHPMLIHLDLAESFLPLFRDARSLFTMDNGQLEWRHYPPTTMPIGDAALHLPPQTPVGDAALHLPPQTPAPMYHL